MHVRPRDGPHVPSAAVPVEVTGRQSDNYGGRLWGKLGSQVSAAWTGARRRQRSASLVENASACWFGEDMEVETGGSARVDSWDAPRAAPAYWKWAPRYADIWWTRLGGLAAIESVRRKRFDELVRFARANSVFYREAYQALPEGASDALQLPIVTKRALMARFDDWFTDRQVTRSGVEAFISDRSPIGERYLQRYVIAT